MTETCPKCGVTGENVGICTERGPYAYGCNIAYVYSCGFHYWVPICGRALIKQHEFTPDANYMPKVPVTVVNMHFQA